MHRNLDTPRQGRLAQTDGQLCVSLVSSRLLWLHNTAQVPGCSPLVSGQFPGGEYPVVPAQCSVVTAASNTIYVVSRYSIFVDGL